jgi:hypothetical protein
MSTQGVSKLSATISNLVKVQKPDTLTATQKDTEAILSAEIAAGDLDPNDRKALSARRAALMKEGGRDATKRTYTPGSAMVDENGEYIGNITFDNTTGKYGIMSADGKLSPVPAGATPSTASSFTKFVADPKTFMQLRNDMISEEQSLQRLSSYLGNVEKAPQGLDRLSNQIATSYKTLFNSGKLTPEQFSLAMASGQLQSLLGASRLQILGGGVMTEQDALRVIAYLGGDVNLLQNKERVREAVTQIYKDKYRTYSAKNEDYNAQVNQHWGKRAGYKNAKPIDFDPSMLNEPDREAGVKSIKGEIDAIKKQLGIESK